MIRSSVSASEALARAGLRSIRFHDLRHTFSTHCASVGVPLRTLHEWLGHRDTTTLIYADHAPNPREAELIERAFAPADPASAVSGMLP